VKVIENDQCLIANAYPVGNGSFSINILATEYY